MSDYKQRVLKKINELRKFNLPLNEFKQKAKIMIYQEANKDLAVYKSNIIKIKTKLDIKISNIKEKAIEKIEQKKIDKIRQMIK